MLSKHPVARHVQRSSSHPSTDFKSHQTNPRSNRDANLQSSDSNQREVRTTLHEYDMIVPYTPHQNMRWYCDNKICQYTEHGVYRTYRIEYWDSVMDASNG